MKISSPRPSERNPLLNAQRQLKMARSAHAYVRGNTLKFYEWLDAATGPKIPQGPAVWICGDCHLGNLGPIANAKGKVEIEIRDLDQTVIGNPAHDLIRLGLSLATAARGSDLPGVTTAFMLEQMMEGYGEAMTSTKPSQMSSGKNAKHMTRPVRIVLRQSLNREWQHLAKERIEDVKPQIPLGRNFWPLSKEEKREVEKLFSEPLVKKLVTSLSHRDDDAPVKVLDAAYWMKGCSSLGRLRYAVLLGVGKVKHTDFCLMDVKEALQAAAPRAAKADMPQNNAERVVEGARKLSPFLGERMLAASFLGKPVVLRELLPQDLKLEMDQLTRDEAVQAARFLAGVVGKAHARQMNAATRKSWHRELQRHRPKSLDAPNWLWASVVDLVASHELAYLEHCRRYAMEQQREQQKEQQKPQKQPKTKRKQAA
jgi:uncharacterized protein (DUF2252 family)